MNLKKGLIWFLKIFTTLVCFGMFMVIVHVWFSAFFNGDVAVVTINEYGEKIPELVMLIVFVPLMSIGTALITRDLWREWL